MIGETVYFFDANRRKYPRDGNGHAYGRVIYRYHFRPELVTGETSRSWITQFGTKFPKSGKNSKAYTLKEVDEACYIQANGIRISDAVRKASYGQLQAIAKIVGYKPLPEPPCE